MERETALKLKSSGIPDGYAAFDYMCTVLTKYNAWDMHNMTMQEIITEIADEFGVSEKAVFHNFELLMRRSWEKAAVREAFGFSDYPTLKEFIYAIIVIMSYRQ